MTIEINGMAHVILTVSQFDAARAFYARLLPEFGMKVVHDGERLSIASVLAPRSASSPAIRHLPGSASCSSGWVCITSACAPGRVRMWTGSRRY
jgi:hypothetical protein